MFLICIAHTHSKALTLFRYKADVDGKDVEVDFWDTAGQERFSSMHPSYYFGAHACILAFDVTRKVTYKNLNDWYKELRKYRENIPVILVANKIDVDYKVTQKKFAFGQKKNIPFEFVSAADGTNVVRVFKDAIRAGVEYKMGDKKDFMDDVRWAQGWVGWYGGCFVAHLCCFLGDCGGCCGCCCSVQVMDLLGDDAIEGEDEDEEGL
jgi:small GTP-binding protein